MSKREWIWEDFEGLVWTRDDAEELLGDCVAELVEASQAGEPLSRLRPLWAEERLLRERLKACELALADFCTWAAWEPWRRERMIERARRARPEHTKPFPFGYLKIGPEEVKASNGRN